MSGPRTIMIGRHTDCDVIFTQETVSRFHAELVVTDAGRYFLVDRNSTHGTWRSIDGGAFKRWERGGYVGGEDRIRFGKTEIKTIRDIAGALD
jgi:pSer/pThr/pTyr-binding forkhead associated (FHA) protein